MDSTSSLQTRDIATSLNGLPVEVRLKRLEALVTAAEALNRASGLNDILRTILDLLVTQLDCDRATTFLLDGRTNKLHAYQMSGGDRVEIVLERGVGIAGYVAECGQTVLTNDAHNDPRFDRSVDKRTGYLTRSILCVPLRKPNGQTIGCLQAINARRDEGFSGADLVYLESFAALAVVAVEREQLAQEALRAQLLSTELEVARKIQQRMLPRPGAVELPPPYTAWGVSKSCYDVGGDCYEALALPSGDCAFWVADVSGKGIGAALLMTTLQTELHGLIHAEPDLAALFAELNERVGAVAPSGTYATVFLGVLSAARRELRYVNAGHLPPVLVRGGDAGEMRSEGGGMPVGLFPAATYEVGRARFEPGMRLLAFSDGVSEAENARGEEFDTVAAAAAVAREGHRDVGRLGEALYESLSRFCLGAPAKDDTTLLLVGLA